MLTVLAASQYMNACKLTTIKRTMLIINLKLLTYLSEKSNFSIREDQQSGMQVDDGDLPVFNLSTIAKATNNFTINNKIGEGGFGPVYRVICS